MRKWIIRLVIVIMREWESEKWFAKHDGLAKVFNRAGSEKRSDVLNDPALLDLLPPPLCIKQEVKEMSVCKL